MTFPTPNAMGIIDILVYVNTVTGGWFWSLTLFSIFIILLFSLKMYPIHTAFSASSFVIFLLGVLFWLIGLISDKIFMITVIMMLGSALLLFLKERSIQ